MANYVGLVDRDRYPEASALSDSDLQDASQAVLNFTDRDFLTAQVTEERIFVPSTNTTTTGDLIVDIDDCDEIYDVDGFSSTQWRAGTDGPAASYGIFTYVEVSHPATGLAADGLHPQRGPVRDPVVGGAGRHRALGLAEQCGA
jgi:hypothetical protein